MQRKLKYTVYSFVTSSDLLYNYNVTTFCISIHEAICHILSQMISIRKTGDTNSECFAIDNITAALIQ